MKIHFFKFIFLFLIITTGITLVGGYFNLIPKAAIFMGTSKPKDLGITYNNKIIESLSEKSGISTSDTTPMKTPNYSGVKELNIKLNSQELTAWARNRGWEAYPVKNVQVKINNNGSVETSALVLTDRVADWISATGGNSAIVETIKSKLPIKLNEMPVYAKGTGSITNNEVTLNFDHLTVSNIPVPTKMLIQNKDKIESFIEDRLKFVSGLYIESLKFEAGEMHFTGTVPRVESFD
jgi:hypothetical protein